MNGRERIEARIHHKPVDHLPFMPITMMFAADFAGVRYRDYASDHRVLAESQLKTAERFGFDYVSVISDPAREASDLGGMVEWYEQQPPAIVESAALLSDKAALARLRLPSMDAPGRMRDRIEGARLLARAVGDTKVVEGWVEGPCALAADLRGVNTLMLDFYDDEAFVVDLFEFVVAMEVAFAAEQVKAGATLIGVGDAAASLVGPKFYTRYVLAFEQRLIAGLHALGVPVRLHICGNTRKILGGMAQAGAEIVDLDFLTPLGDGRAAMGDAQVLLGNIDPVRLLRDGTPESVEAAIAACHAEAGTHYIVGAGCEVARGTPHENVEAMGRYAREHR